MRLRDYREKPRVKLWGTDDYYLGVELEVEAPNLEAQQVGLKPLVWGVHAKHDGSLNDYGWEIVTHPFARNMWLDTAPKKGPVKRFYRLVKDLRDLNYQSHDGGRCGLHAHVCRKAFGLGLPLGSHFFWFARLVNGPLFRKISQRDDGSLDRWTKQIMPKIVRTRNYGPEYHRLLGVSFGHCGRYVALNITSKTIEVRLFRGNLREDRIRKALEAVVAGVEFARTRSSRNWNEDLDKEFVAYVLRNKRVYPNLAAYLRELNLTKTTEDNAVEVVAEVASV